jgi:uncharacterized protein (DUF2267 family)
MVRYPELIDFVQDRAGLSSRQEAEASVHAVFEVISRRVVPADRRRVLSLLPEPLHVAFAHREFRDDADLDAVVEEVAQAEDVHPGFGREHLDVVGAAAVATLHPEAITALRTHLPSSIAVIFSAERESRATRATPASNPRVNRRHLAEGRSGSAHPLSEGRADTSQSDSVARSGTPKVDTKISSARGLTQEREHESLADGSE